MVSYDRAVLVDRVLLGRLIPDENDPWEHSQEGLDDCCHFCGEECSSTAMRRGETSVYFHRPDCVWLEAMEYLGRRFRPGTEHRRTDG